MDHPPAPRAEVKRVELNGTIPSGIRRLFKGKLYILPHGILRQNCERKMIYTALDFLEDRDVRAFDTKGNVHLM
jgi:hypothetical protein